MLGPSGNWFPTHSLHTDTQLLHTKRLRASTAHLDGESHPYAPERAQSEIHKEMGLKHPWLGVFGGRLHPERGPYTLGDSPSPSRCLLLWSRAAFWEGVCVLCVRVCVARIGAWGGFGLSQITAAKFCIWTRNLTKHYCSPHNSWLQKENPSIHSSSGNCCLHIRTGQSQLLTRAAKNTPPSCL